MPRCPNPRCQADYPAGTVQCTNPFCQCLLPSAVVAGRYRIETLIGMGGMGAVYRVSDTFEMTQVALKTLLLANSTDVDTAVERFRREARYAHQLRHKNIVPVLNFGQDGSILYLVMPLVTGGTLKGLLKAERPLPIKQVQQYVNDLADAIDIIHAHPQQIVHRDIKPSNLLIHQDNGRLVVADFGIARAMQNEKALTQRGWAIGTEHYVAPEQEQGKAEPVSDIYSMGVVTYQMLTGLLPFQAVVKSRATEIPAPSTLNSALPPAVDVVVFKAMEIEPHKRYQNAHDFATAFNDALASGLPVEQSELPPTVMVTSTANVLIRTIIPENPCGQCGRENRSGSRFCRYCGHTLNDTSPLVTDVCQVGYISDKGQAKEDEDMLLIAQGLCVNLTPPPRPFSLLAIADGLRDKQGRSIGGHEASRLAVETVADTLLPLLSASSRSHSQLTPHHYALSSATLMGQSTRTLAPADTILEQWVRDSIWQANQVIYHCNADYDKAMNSTLSVALLYKHRLYVASVGDSRVYHYNPISGLRCITSDHTLAAQLVEAQLIELDELYNTPKRNQHYRALGRSYTLTIDSFQVETKLNDLILLCTDGLWHVLRDEQISKVLSANSATDTQQLAQTLVDAALAVKGEGNISAIVARVQ